MRCMALDFAFTCRALTHAADAPALSMQHLCCERPAVHAHALQSRPERLCLVPMPWWHFTSLPSSPFKVAMWHSAVFLPCFSKETVSSCGMHCLEQLARLLLTHSRPCCVRQHALCVCLWPMPNAVKRDCQAPSFLHSFFLSHILSPVWRMCARRCRRGVRAAGEWAFLVNAFVATVEPPKAEMVLYKFRPQPARGLQEAKIRDLQRAAQSRSQRNIRRVASIPSCLSRGSVGAAGPKPCAPSACCCEMSGPGGHVRPLERGCAAMFQGRRARSVCDVCSSGPGRPRERPRVCLSHCRPCTRRRAHGTRTHRVVVARWSSSRCHGPRWATAVYKFHVPGHCMAKQPNTPRHSNHQWPYKQPGPSRWRTLRLKPSCHAPMHDHVLNFSRSPVGVSPV